MSLRYSSVNLNDDIERDVACKQAGLAAPADGIPLPAGKYLAGGDYISIYRTLYLRWYPSLSLDDIDDALSEAITAMWVRPSLAVTARRITHRVYRIAHNKLYDETLRRSRFESSAGVDCVLENKEYPGESITLAGWREACKQAGLAAVPDTPTTRRAAVTDPAVAAQLTANTDLPIAVATRMLAHLARQMRRREAADE
jgi:hypothetical protein